MLYHAEVKSVVVVNKKIVVFVVVVFVEWSLTFLSIKSVVLIRFLIWLPFSFAPIISSSRSLLLWHLLFIWYSFHIPSVFISYIYFFWRKWNDIKSSLSVWHLFLELTIHSHNLVCATIQSICVFKCVHEDTIDATTYECG